MSKSTEEANIGEEEIKYVLWVLRSKRLSQQVFRLKVKHERSQRVRFGETHCSFDCPLSQDKLKYAEGLCPRAEELYSEDLLPLVYPALIEQDPEGCFEVIKEKL